MLRNEYASLLLRLGQLEKAEKVIQQSLSINPNNAASNQQQPIKASDHHLMIQDVRNLMLMAKLQEKNGQQSSASSLVKAQELVTILLRKLPDDQPDVVSEHKTIAASISTKLASIAILQHDPELAIRCYREALAHLPDNINAMAQLAKVYLQTDDFEHCQHIWYYRIL